MMSRAGTGMAPRYATGEADVDAAAEDLLRLWSGNLGSMGDEGPAKLDWYYRAAPTGRGRVILLRALDAGREEVVGCQGIGFRRFLCGERSLRAALLADLAVDRPHRSLFPALTLVRGTRAVAADAADFQYGFPNRVAIELFRRLGYQVVGHMARYAKVLRFAPYVAQATTVPFVARGGGAVLDAAEAALAAVPGRRAASAYRLAGLPEPDRRFDALFDEARRPHRLIAERGRDFLRWRFFGAHSRSELVALIRRADDALRGYAVLTPRGGAVHLSDFLAASDAELEALLRLLAPELRARGFASVSARFLGTARVPRVLARCRFRLRDAERAVVLDAAGDAALAVALADLEGHYLTDADEDS
jgi:hypothetical protein